MGKIWQATCTAVLVYCMLVSVALVLVLYIILMLPLRLISHRWDAIVQEICQSMAVYIVLGVCGFPVDSQLITSLPEETTEQYLAYKALQDGYEFERQVRERLKTAPPLVEECIRLRRRDIIIANHQIYVDWLYIWSLAVPLNRAGSIKIILKRSLLFAIPVLGIGMKLFNFIFLHRNWEIDKVKFERRLKRLAYGEGPFSLVIFPEGTTLCAETLQKSHRYAEKNQLVQLTNVLLPRTTGVQFALTTLDHSIDGILDLTIGYTGIKKGQVPEEIYGIHSLFMERVAPPFIHVHVRYHPLATIPYRNPEEFSRWLTCRFEEKDRLLDEFYRNGTFPGPQSKLRSVAPRSAVIWCLVAGLMATVVVWYGFSCLIFPYLLVKRDGIISTDSSK